jgi:hypothetical protein
VHQNSTVAASETAISCARLRLGLRTPVLLKSCGDVGGDGEGEVRLLKVCRG